MNNNKIKIPNFFIVGEPKCGTTSLYNYLKQHPEIFMPEVKEPHYFCTDFHKESDLFHKKIKAFRLRSKKDYLELFSKCNKKKIIGEASVHYAYSKNAAKNIYNFNPNSKIIIMIREPVEFLHSLHSEFYSQIMEIKSFERAILLENERRENWGKINKNIATPSFVYYSDRVKFCNHITKFQDLFAKKNVKIILLDDLRCNPEKVYKSVLRFLNVNNINFKAKLEVINSNKKIRFLLIRKLFKFLGSLSCRTLVPKKWRKYIQDKILKITTVHKKRLPISCELSRELKIKYKNEVIKLDRILKRDLIKLWKYDQVS